MNVFFSKLSPALEQWFLFLSHQFTIPAGMTIRQGLHRWNDNGYESRLTIGCVFVSEKFFRGQHRPVEDMFEMQFIPRDQRGDKGEVLLRHKHHQEKFSS